LSTVIISQRQGNVAERVVMSDPQKRTNLGKMNEKDNLKMQIQSVWHTALAK